MTLVDVAKTAVGLKDVKRSGWIKRLSIADGESVADHSYSTTIISMLLSDSLNLDSERVMKMALLHDLAESKIGDIIPGQISDALKEKIETSAFFEIVSLLPDNLKSQYVSIWQEFCAGKTTESQIVRQADKLEMSLQAVTYKNKGLATAKEIEIFLNATDKVITDDTARDFFTKLVN